MPSKTTAQRNLMGAALAHKRDPSKPASPEVKSLAASMTEKQLRDFAKKPKGR